MVQLQIELANQQLKLVVEKYTETDAVRLEYQQQLQYERQQHDRESKRADAWVREPRDCFELEKQQLVEQIQALEIERESRCANEYVHSAVSCKFETAEYPPKRGDVRYV